MALNKMDLEDAHVLRDEIHASILTAAQRMQVGLQKLHMLH